MFTSSLRDPINAAIRVRYPLLSVLTLFALAACGGGGYGGGNSSYSTSNPSMSSSSSSSTSSLSMTFSTDQIYPEPTSTATATATFLADSTSGSASGTVTLSGVTATSVTVNDAFAGNTGPVVLSLTQSISDPNVWNVSSGAILTVDQISDLLAGKLYVLVSSAANANGELRGQIVPGNIKVAFAPMGGVQESPSVTTTASGVAAVTVNTTTKTAAVNINTTGVDTASGAQLLASFVGSSTAIATLVPDNSLAGHWLNESITLSDADIANFNSSRWLVNVFTTAHISGEIRGQIAVNPPTLSTLQASIFGAICATCHTGVGSTLPGVQNFTTASSTYAAAVNVASLEQSTLVRIRPYDPDNSYLVRKIEGDPTITGARMPFGGQLTQTQIDQIRAWAAAGAKNN